MRFRSGDQVQSFGCSMVCQGIARISRQTEHVVESMAGLQVEASASRKSKLVNAVRPIHKLTILGGV
jgi:hypothetical protein